MFFVSGTISLKVKTAGNQPARAVHRVLWCHFHFPEVADVDVMLNKLAATRSLWVAFVSTVVITIAFQVVTSIWGISFIDALSDPAEVRQAISDMTRDQRAFHAWITATLDVAYPLAYGALFVGSAYAFYGRLGRYIAIPLLLVVPIDLLEGVVQVLALTDVADLIDAKAVLTPLKFILFLLGLATMVIGWALWLFSRLRNSQGSR